MRPRDERTELAELGILNFLVAPGVDCDDGPLRPSRVALRDGHLRPSRVAAIQALLVLDSSALVRLHPLSSVSPLSHHAVARARAGTHARMHTYAAPPRVQVHSACQAPARVARVRAVEDGLTRQAAAPSDGSGESGRLSKREGRPDPHSVCARESTEGFSFARAPAALNQAETTSEALSLNKKLAWGRLIC